MRSPFLCTHYSNTEWLFNHAPAFYRARWLVKATWHVYSTWCLIIATWISGRISGKSLCFDFVINQHFFSQYCFSYRKVMRDKSKTCLVGLLIRSIFSLEKLHSRWSARAFFPRKSERINKPTRRALLQITIAETSLYPIVDDSFTSNILIFLSKIEINACWSRYKTG